MNIDFAYVDGTMTVTLFGELDESNAHNVRKQLDEKIERIRPIRVIFDLEELLFMDSTGVGLFVGRYKKHKNPTVFYIKSPSIVVDKILKLSGIYTIMPRIDKEFV